MIECVPDAYFHSEDEFTLRIFERLGLIKRAADGNGGPVYLRTEFGIRFLDAHRLDSAEEFDKAIERLKPSGDKVYNRKVQRALFNNENLVLL